MRKYAKIVIHFGLLIGLIGVWLNQSQKTSGYLFLELAGGTKNFFLSKNFQSINEIPFSLRLDSIRTNQQKGFEPAPIVWLQISSNNQNSVQKLSYNQPFYYQGWQLLLSNLVEPGFPLDYELSSDGQTFSLLHNQHLVLPNYKKIWSYGYDSEMKRINLLIGDRSEWLGIGDTLRFDKSKIVLQSINFALHQGVILLVKDIRLRFIIFVGFGLMLVGLIPVLFTKKKL